MVMVVEKVRVSVVVVMGMRMRHNTVVVMVVMMSAGTAIVCDTLSMCRRSRVAPPHPARRRFHLFIIAGPTIDVHHLRIAAAVVVPSLVTRHVHASRSFDHPLLR